MAQDLLNLYESLLGWMRSPVSAYVPADSVPAYVPAHSVYQFASDPNASSGSSGSRGGKETVEVHRRRRTTSSGRRERAERTERDRDDEVAATPPSSPPPPPRPPSGGGSGYSGSSGGGSSSGGHSGGAAASAGLLSLLLGLFGGKRRGCLPMPVLVIAVLFLCIVLFFLSRSCGGPQQNGDGLDGSISAATSAPAQQQVAPTPTRRPSSASSNTVDRAGEHAEWLVMLYQDADDKILEEDIYVDLNEAERAGSGENVHVVSQIDRYSAGYRGDGDWSGARRYYISYDEDLQHTASYEVEDLGEVNMADGRTLTDFVTWAVDRYPADKYVLILSDHGMGWPGGWTDPTASGRSNGDSPMEQRLSDQIFLNELDGALAEIQRQTGMDKFELIGLDACLMAHLEVFTVLEPYARYAVASQETEPAVGWAYASFIQALSDNPNMDGADLAKRIVNSYIDEDQRILDDQARAEMMNGRAPSAAQLSRKMGENVTLSAVDLSALPELNSAVNDLAYSLQGAGGNAVAKAQKYAQAYTSVFGRSVPASYIDLGNFTQILQDQLRGDGLQSIQRVQNAIDDMVIAERHGSSKKGSNGVSIYFPNSTLYADPVTGYQSYDVVASRFAAASLWDDFLSYFYTGDSFDQSAGVASVPSSPSSVQSPVAQDIQLSPITASRTSVAPGQTVKLSVDISGNNIGYIKLFAGYLDESGNSIYVADEDYLESDETREQGGVYYPVWPSGEFTMEFDWEPIVFAVDDGNVYAEAVFRPESYGQTFEDTIYTVAGTYLYADGEERPAQLQFKNGELDQVFGFTNENATGAVREILPQTGDRFTVHEKWLDLDANGSVRDVVYEKGKTIEFGATPITWIDLDAAAGDYVVGFIVEDLDGKQYPVFTNIEVR